MGIKSTQYIHRRDAIHRIKVICNCVDTKNYKLLEDICLESDENVESFVDNCDTSFFVGIYNYSDSMLENIIDKPFFRFSMFDNYFIKD